LQITNVRLGVLAAGAIKKGMLHVRLIEMPPSMQTAEPVTKLDFSPALCGRH